MFEIIYHKKVVSEDIKNLDATWCEKIKAAIEKKLENDPAKYGKPLRFSLKGYRAMRVGYYCVVFRVEQRRVLVFAIVHRRVVYEQAEKRI